jgi:hypothetical protein
VLLPRVRRRKAVVCAAIDHLILALDKRSEAGVQVATRPAMLRTPAQAALYA